ncbi:MAG: 30S ribosomal protein S6 [Varibaculum sp.]|nr:30S ribosomal protein S6 [Varibaculum sp.]
MRKYELMIILSPEVDERTVTPVLEKMLAVVVNDGGQIEKTDIWGKRRLAYPIAKQSEGLYVVVDMFTNADTARELDRQLSLNETVLRTKLLRRD